MATEKQVLIVGAGPVGLTMAIQLARYGVGCRIIDQLEAPLPYCRALGVTPRTLEIWQEMGIAREMIDAGIWITGRRIIINNTVLPDTAQDIQGLPFGNLSIPQPVTEEILAKHLALYNINVERGTRLGDLQQQDGQVTATLSRQNKPDEKQTFTYVIGCDGAHSMVRRLAGIAFEGERMPYDFMLGDVKINWDLPKGYALQSIRAKQDSAPDFLVAIPLPEENRYRVSMMAPPELSISEGSDHGIQSERPVPELAPLQQAFDRLYPGVTLSDLRWSSIFRISMRLAAKYRTGNIFLAGDAAHIHPPTGGQGMNTGIQDAYNLAWKLAMILNESGSEELLDSYEKERQAEGMNVINQTLQASMNPGKRGFQLDRLTASQLLVNYRESPVTIPPAVIPETKESLRAGDRAPDCEGLKRQGIARALRLSEVMSGTQHILLLFSESPETAALSLAAVLNRLAEQYGEPIKKIVRLVAIVPAESLIQPHAGTSILHDATGDFANVYRLAGDDAWLIRPDQYLAWSGSVDDLSGTISYFDKILNRKQ